MSKATNQFTPDQEKIWDALNRQFMAPETQLLSRKEAIEYTDDDTATRGWYWRLSASGYLDCTDWSGPFNTEFSAVLDCIDACGDDVELEDEED